MGGDYWIFGERYHLWCNKCNNFTRTTEKWVNPELYNFIDKYVDYFGEVLDDYNDGGTIVELRERHKKREEDRHPDIY